MFFSQFPPVVYMPHADAADAHAADAGNAPADDWPRLGLRDRASDGHLEPAEGMASRPTEASPRRGKAKQLHG
ncbi:unnamed protein product, partial [Symbiodinium sp. CCMP2456]